MVMDYKTLDDVGYLTREELLDIINEQTYQINTLNGMLSRGLSYTEEDVLYEFRRKWGEMIE